MEGVCVRTIKNLIIHSFQKCEITITIDGSEDHDIDIRAFESYVVDVGVGEQYYGIWVQKPPPQPSTEDESEAGFDEAESKSEALKYSVGSGDSLNKW